MELISTYFTKVENHQLEWLYDWDNVFKIDAN